MSDKNQAVPVLAAELAQLRSDAALWNKAASLMSFEHSGPNAGWTLSILLPGDTPADAVSDYKVPPKWEPFAPLDSDHG
jgi:hypothetical protein